MSIRNEKMKYQIENSLPTKNFKPISLCLVCYFADYYRYVYLIYSSKYITWYEWD